MPRPSRPRRLMPVVVGLVAWYAGILPAAESVHAPITIDALITLARAHAPTGDRVAAERALAAAAVREAGAWRNPELALAGGRARFRGEDGSAGIGSVALAQPLPSPWRRDAEQAVAQAGLPQAEATAALAWLELELAVREAAADHVTADEALLLAGAASDTARTMRAAVESRARAGEAGLAELARARVEESQARLTEERRRREVAATRAALATWCGTTLPDDPLIADALPLRFPALDRERLLRAANDSGPRLRLLNAEHHQRELELTARSRAWHPDLTLGGALTREADSDNWEVTLGIEIPLWNRQQGASDRAAAACAKSEAGLRAARSEQERTVLAAWSAYERERLQLEALVATVHPAAVEAQRLTLAAFQGGTASFADLMEARRALVRSDDEALATRRAVVDAWLRLAAATGDCQLATEMKP